MHTQHTFFLRASRSPEHIFNTRNKNCRKSRRILHIRVSLFVIRSMKIRAVISQQKFSRKEAKARQR
jgi:hypothetical protein